MSTDVQFMGRKYRTLIAVFDSNLVVVRLLQTSSDLPSALLCSCGMRVWRDVKAIREDAISRFKTKARHGVYAFLHGLVVFSFCALPCMKAWRTKNKNNFLLFLLSSLPQTSKYFLYTLWWRHQRHLLLCKLPGDLQRYVFGIACFLLFLSYFSGTRRPRSCSLCRLSFCHDVSVEFRRHRNLTHCRT